MSKCQYGCEQEYKFILKNGKFCCSDSYNKCPAVKEKNSEGLKRSYKEGSRKKSTDVYDSLPQETKDKMAWSRGKNLTPLKDVFKEGTSWGNSFLRSKVLENEIFKYECSRCFITKWNNQDIVLELDHINGVRTDNRKENLRWLCPNCHSQTDTFRGRNINTGSPKLSDDELIKLIKNGTSIRQVLIDAGLAPKGSNYKRIQKLIIKNDLILEKGNPMIFITNSNTQITKNPDDIINFIYSDDFSKTVKINSGDFCITTPCPRQCKAKDVTIDMWISGSGRGYESLKEIRK